MFANVFAQFLSPLLEPRPWHIMWWKQILQQILCLLYSQLTRVTDETDGKAITIEERLITT